MTASRVSVFLWNADGTGHDAVITDVAGSFATVTKYTNRAVVSIYSFKDVETYFSNGKLIATRHIWTEFIHAGTGHSWKQHIDGMRVPDAGWGNRNRYILNALGIYSLKTGDRKQVEAEALRLMSDMLMKEALRKLTQEGE